jgi:outer membrane protein OmpA-like peptidoglycan-associated protein
VTTSDGDTYTAAFTVEIKFDYDKSEINQAYLKDIEVLYATYKQHKEAYIEISGHTDSKGSESHNKTLSQLRADAVKKYLVNKGVPKDHIITKAIGEEQPISPNINPDGSDNPEGRSNNRRTDIKIVNY